MVREINIDALLLGITEASPAGIDLRYTTFYEEIMEARRYEDAIALGDWQREVKSSEWEKVVELCVSALTTRSKDLQIAVWLAEALTVLDGFRGMETGFRLVSGLMERFWDSMYPLLGEGDLEYRAAPFEFLNQKVAFHTKLIPLTDPDATPGYPWFKWQESREVGYEAATRNRYGEADEEKKVRREQRLAENAVSAEQFDAAAAASAGAFAQALSDELRSCMESFRNLERQVGERFGAEGPSLADLGGALDACCYLLKELYPEQVGGGRKEAPVPEREAEGLLPAAEGGGVEHLVAPSVQELEVAAPVPSSAMGAREGSMWDEAVAMLETGRLHDALAMLLYTSNGADCARDRVRVRLLMGKLCLMAKRADLARPIMEELHGVIEELQLERWESPIWIAEVFDAYYQCLAGDDPSESDASLAHALLKRICSLDVTKAMAYRI